MKTLTLVVCALITLCVGSATSVSPEPERKVMAFYYTWYGTPQTSGSWIHWDEGGHKPDNRDSRGYHNTGTTNHPPQPYDSNDHKVIDRHLALAQKAGIDVLISTWWDQGDYHDKALTRLMDRAKKTPVKVSIYYERVPDGPDSKPSVDRTVKDFSYILDKHSPYQAFFRHRGKPVIFIYGRAMGQLSREQWSQVVRKVKEKRQVMLIADSRSPEWLDIFDGLHEYNTVGQVLAQEDFDEQARRLVHDCKAKGKTSSVTVIPGYDDSNIGRLSPIIAPRRHGLLYREMWNAAVKSRPDWIVICSFNEWHEGSEIEPSREHGSLYIDLTGQYSRAFKLGKDGKLVDPALSRVSGVSTSGNIIYSASLRSSGAITVTNLDRNAGTISLTGRNNARWIVNEIGRNGKAFRRVSVTGDTKKLSWTARPFTAYEVWEHRALSNYVRAASASDRKKDPALAFLAHELMGEDVGLRTDVRLKFADKLPQEYRMCVDKPFSIECILSNTGKRPVKASLTRLTVPDDWTVSPAPDTTSLAVPAGSARTWTFNVSAPVRTVYDLAYPIMALWNVSSGKDQFNLQSCKGVRMVHPFDKDVRFTALSPTQTEMHLSLKSNFPGMELRDLDVEVDLPEGWKSEPEKEAISLQDSKSLSFRITKPSNDVPGLKVASAIFTLGQYKGSKRSITDLYVTMGDQARAQGLWQVDVGDGKTEVTARDGHKCRRAIDSSPGQPCYIYFAVSENLPTSTPVYVTVHYFDEGTDAFSLQYDSTDPAGGLDAAYKNTPQIRRTNTQTWKTHTFTLSDARFKGAQNGQADFRINSIGRGVCVDWVAVSKFPDSDL